VRREAAGVDVHASLSAIKVHGIEAATTAAMDLVKLLGSRGVSRDEPAERMVRDLMGLAILGGTVELQKIVIYNEMTRELAKTRATPKKTTMAATPVEFVDEADIDEALEAALIDVVAAAHPLEVSLRGRWYYDSGPDRVALVRRGGVVVGVTGVVFAVFAATADCAAGVSGLVGVGGDAGGADEIANGAGGVEGHALVFGWEKAGGPIDRASGRKPAGIGQHDEGRQVFVFRAQSITEPRAHAGKAIERESAIHLEGGRGVVITPGEHRVDEAKIIHTARDLRQQTAHP
jgi:hypothetical protein